MSVFAKIYCQAKKNPKKVVLPEIDDGRVLEAAACAARENLARVILLGSEGKVRELFKKNGLDIGNIEIIDPREDGKRKEYAAIYEELRKHKGVTAETAEEQLLRDTVYYAALMLREGRVDSFVAGASHTTSDVVRAALYCIERAEGYRTVSGSFLVEVQDTQYGENGLFLFADCGVVPLPKPVQLADIAITSAETWNKITGYPARLALLSFSSKGSSVSANVDKIREAYEIIRREKPDLMVDGELQVDSAIVPAVAKIKVPQSPLEGRANILIFPNLDAGNIAYKLVQRLAGARVAGPILQGLARPCSDLSRGATVQEIIDAIAVSVVRAQ